MMASTHVYDLAAAAKEKDKGRSMLQKDSSAVELALDPSELDLVDTAAMEARYEQTLKEKQSSGLGEDLSDMVAEHAAKQKVFLQYFSCNWIFFFKIFFFSFFRTKEKGNYSNRMPKRRRNRKNSSFRKNLRIVTFSRFFL